MAKIRVLLCGENSLMRRGATGLLNTYSDIRSKDVALEPDSIALAVRSFKPNVVLLESRREKEDLLRSLLAIRTESASALVIEMGVNPAGIDIVSRMGAGIVGFILADVTLADVVVTVRAVAKGEKVLPPSLLQPLFAQIHELALQSDPHLRLHSPVLMTVREQTVVKYISDGLCNKDIANKMNISIHTVKSHIRTILDKLSLHSRLEIANFYFSGHSNESS